MHNKIDVRLRFEDDDYNTWEERPVLATFLVYQGKENQVVSKLIAGFEDSDNPVQEARWNFQLSLQGHYISR